MMRWEGQGLRNQWKQVVTLQCDPDCGCDMLTLQWGHEDKRGIQGLMARAEVSVRHPSGILAGKRVCDQRRGANLEVVHVRTATKLNEITQE